MKNYGFIPDSYNPEDYVLGGRKLPSVILQEDGQWTDFLPKDELQAKNGLETSNCTVYGTLNCIEILMKRVFGLKLNYSERYVGVMAKTTRRGNSPKKVIDIIKNKSGVIADALLPFSDNIDTWVEYYSPDPMSRVYKSEGKDWRREFKIRYEWVFKGGKLEDKQKALIEALPLSPIGVSVYAWKKEGEYYIKTGQSDNHWVTIYGYEIGKYWKIFDSYDNTYKKLDWNYDFGFAMRYHIEKKIGSNLFIKFFLGVRRLLNMI